FTQSGGAATDMKFDAGPNYQGAKGNAITINFTKVNGNAPPDGNGGFARTNATFSGPNNDQINVPLYSGLTNGHVGTTAQDVADAINFNSINVVLGVILVSPGG